MRANTRHLEWQLITVAESLLIQMDRAATRLSQARREKYQLITHLFARMYVASSNGLFIFRVGTKDRPARITAIALDLMADGTMFFLDDADQIPACCDHFGIEDPNERRAFFELVTTRAREQSGNGS